MKVLVILGLLFAFSQATTDIVQRAAELVSECAQEKGVDVDKIKGIMKHNELPVDDEEFTKFFGCYYDKLGFLDDKGKFHEDKLKSALPHLIKSKYGDDIDADQLAKDCLDHCNEHKDVKGVVDAIKLRNCGIKYVAEHHSEHHHHH